MSNLIIEQEESVTTITINRPAVRNAIDGPTADELAAVFKTFDQDDSQKVAVLTGADNTFCAGADLKAISEGRGNRVTLTGDGPLGCSRDRKSTRLNSSHDQISYAVFCLKKKKRKNAK